MRKQLIKLIFFTSVILFFSLPSLLYLFESIADYFKEKKDIPCTFCDDD